MRYDEVINRLPNPNVNGTQWLPPTKATIQRAIGQLDQCLLAWPDGWKPVRIIEVVLNNNNKAKPIKHLLIETEHGGVMEISAQQLRQCMLIRVMEGEVPF